MTGPDNDNKVQTYSLQTKGIKLVCQNAAKSSDYETNTIIHTTTNSTTTNNNNRL